jgi:hypothetical protein
MGLTWGAGHEDLIHKIVSRMGSLNETIKADSKNLGPGFQIGHSYFSPTKATTLNEEWYQRVIDAEIVPLLQEYWFDDEKKAENLTATLLD